MKNIFPYPHESKETNTTTVIFVTGDLVLARGIDQSLSFPGSPILHESGVRNARTYVSLARYRLSKENKKDTETDNLLDGNKILLEIQKKNIFSPTRWKQKRSLWLTNLETALTKNGVPYPKGINYRANPANVYFLKQFQSLIQCPLVLSLANNHVLDYGMVGLLETFDTLDKNHLRYVGAGKNLIQAIQPQIVQGCMIFGVAHPSSGVPFDWRASISRPGVFLISDLKQAVIFLQKLSSKNPDNLTKVLMIHYGANWQDRMDPEFRRFCHNLIDESDFRLIVNTSPHHRMPIEVYKKGIICYAPGDFINDYYGIVNLLHDEYQPDLGSVIETRFSETSSSYRSHVFERIGFRLHFL